MQGHLAQSNLPVAGVTSQSVVAMGRVLIALCYVWATIVDQSVGTFWKLGSGDDPGGGSEVIGSDYTNGFTNGSRGAANGVNRSFEWWSFRAFWEGGRYKKQSSVKTGQCSEQTGAS